LIKTDIEDPSNFDAFINCYPQILENIRQKHPNKEIIINISSGTTQMISALCLEIASSKYPYKAIQVKTPLKESNIKPREFNIEKEFSELKDQTTNSQRCNEPEILNFRKTINKSEILSLINKFDYNAAVEIFDETLFKNKNVFHLLNHAKYRLYLQTDKAKELISDFIFDFYPVKNQELSDFIEYFYVMKVKQLNGELSDFILKLTPLLTNLMIHYINRYFSIENLIECDGKMKNFSREKIQNFKPELLAHLDDKCKGKDDNGCFRDGFVSSFGLNLIIEFITKNPPSNFNHKELNNLNCLKKSFGSLRDKEDKIRNLTAHEMISVTEDLIKHHTDGKTSNNLLMDIQKLLTRLFPEDFDQNLFIYEKLNKLIEENLE
ncbi:MAG: hypothetical protein AB1782_06105, partial [Cyanobacteriota bacterium]